MTDTPDELDPSTVVTAPPADDLDSTEDFDAYWSQVTRKAKTVRVFGQDVTLPPSLPLQFELEAKRLKGSSDPDDVAHLVGLLFGADALVGWSAAGMDGEQFGVLLLWATVRVSDPKSRMDLAEAHRLYLEKQAGGGPGKAPGKKPKKPKRGTSGRS